MKVPDTREMVRMRAFPVKLASGPTHWTVFDEELAGVEEAAAFLRRVRFDRDGAG